MPAHWSSFKKRKILKGVGNRRIEGNRRENTIEKNPINISAQNTDRKAHFERWKTGRENLRSDTKSVAGWAKWTAEIIK